PHFEKMLYDNALLLATMARCWRRTADHDSDRRDLYSHAARRTVAWLNREMRLPNGLYAAGLDADSDDAAGHTHEGIYYLWNQDLITDALGT
ncbi:thioredoxin domain-containing protein, partial [Xanthomonas citri pv. citri]|nr:thioredoxin domain-containing protein [Xanthomonas citri pv. citri]